MKHILLAAIIASTLVIPALYAQEGNSENSADTKSSQNDGDRKGGKRNNGELSDRALRIIDTDKDGKVSVEEYMAHSQQRFSDMDLDNDNFVTTEEAKTAADNIRQRQNEARSALEQRTNSRDNKADSE